MLVILFAGGVGQRLWPISRRNSPKQFVALTGTRSSFQIAVDRATRIARPEEIFVATNEIYAETLRAQAPLLPPRNFILEPARRDVAAAVALAFFTLQKDGRSGPVMFVWTDNYVQHEENLATAVDAARDIVEADPQRLIFIGEKPRFPNENLGWIELGDELGSTRGLAYYTTRSFRYRPSKDVATQMYAEGNYVWNAGYFVTSIEFMTQAFRSLAPDLTAMIESIVAARGRPDEQRVLREQYPRVPALHFDQAILERLPAQQAILLPVELGWSDPGSLYSLKEALQTSAESTVTVGDVVELGTKDSLLYNQNPGKLVAAMGLEGIVVVETPDVTLVIHRDSVRHLGELLERVQAAGWDRVL